KQLNGNKRPKKGATPVEAPPAEPADGAPDAAGLTPNQRRFLAAYARVGNVTAAADLAGLCRTNHYLWSPASPAYAEAFRAAQEEAVERLEEEARRRAMAGSDLLLIFLLKALRPEVYRERHEHRHGGSTDAPPVQHEHRVKTLQAVIDRLPDHVVGP